MKEGSNFIALVGNKAQKLKDVIEYIFFFFPLDTSHRSSNRFPFSNVEQMEERKNLKKLHLFCKCECW